MFKDLKKYNINITLLDIVDVQVEDDIFETIEEIEETKVTEYVFAPNINVAYALARDVILNYSQSHFDLRYIVEEA